VLRKLLDTYPSPINVFFLAKRSHHTFALRCPPSQDRARTTPAIPHHHIDYAAADQAEHNPVIKFLDAEQAKFEIKIILNETGDTLSPAAVDALAKWKLGEHHSK